MSLTQTYTTSIKSANGGTVVSQSVAYNGDIEEDISDVVAASDTLTFDIALDVSQIQAFYIYSDQDVAVQPKSGGVATADGPFALTARKAFWWNTDRQDARPLTADIAQLEFTNTGATPANVKAGFLLNDAA